MTSRALFYKAMREDFRHKIWMFALSCLASFMAMPVFYLLLSQEWYRRIERRYQDFYPDWDEAAYRLEVISEFFGQNMVITGGIVLGVGAVIVGLFGFRYVFSKKMMDLYHSIPIKRTQLFLISYVNGFLIWFVPMLLGAVICLIMAAGFLGESGAWLWALKIMLKSIGHMTVVFLLFYNLIITAVMLSGNYLNTLLTILILGLLVITAWLMLQGYAGTYFASYYSMFDETFQNIVWLSPIVSGICQLGYYVTEDTDKINLLANMAMVVLLWIAAFGLYLKRPSEMAEQGLKLKGVQLVFRTSVTILGALAGWLFFGYLTDIESVGWTIFGAIFGGVLVFGVLDMIFHMEFRAFYAHKLQMAICVLASIGIGMVFMFDLTGFDCYVPKMEQIADMGMYMGNIAGYNYISAEKVVDEMHYTDAEVIHSFLQTVSDPDAYLEGNTRWITVRVGKTNGKSYYRRYLVGKEYEAQMLPILRDESYLLTNVLVSPKILEHVTVEDEHFRIYGESDTIIIRDVEEARAFLKAYNEDVLEDPDRILYQRDKILATLSADNWNNESYGSENFYDFELDIYEGMEHTLALIEANGYENVLQTVPVEAVSSISVELYKESEDQSIEEAFGLTEAVDEQENAKTQETVVEDIVSAQAYTVESTVIESVYIYSATFTEKEDIQKLLDIVYFHSPSGGTSILAAGGYCNASVQVNELDGSVHWAELKKGTMPVELLSYFE